MDWNTIYPGPEEPTPEQLSAYVSDPLWDELNRWICEAYSLAPKYTYSCCSMGRGWNVKYRVGSRALCTLDRVLEPSPVWWRPPPRRRPCSPPCRRTLGKLWRAARPMNSVRWLSLEVSSPQVLEDVKALLLVKQKPKHAGQA